MVRKKGRLGNTVSARVGRSVRGSRVVMMKGSREGSVALVPRMVSSMEECGQKEGKAILDSSRLRMDGQFEGRL